MAKKYLDYTGLQAFKTKCDETYLKKVDGVDTTIFVIDTSLDKASKTDGKIHIIVDDKNKKYNDNQYNEYFYINNRWELIGHVASITDLSEYVTTSTLNTEINNISGSIETINTEITNIKTTIGAMSGGTAPDLSNYVTTATLNNYLKTSDMTAITNDEIDNLFK